jgi:hypothetical protein
MPEERINHAKEGEVGKLGKDGKLGGYQGDAILCRWNIEAAWWLAPGEVPSATFHGILVHHCSTRSQRRESGLTVTDELLPPSC